MERLGKVVVRPDFQSPHLVVQRVFGRHDDDPDRILPLPYLTQDVQPVAAGQHQVEQHTVVVVEPDLLQCFGVGESLLAHIVFGTEVGHDAGRQFPFVFDYQQFHFSNIRMLPPVISSAPATTRRLTGSFRNRNDRQMVMTTLSLSIGATRDTSPVCNALK